MDTSHSVESAQVSRLAPRIVLVGRGPGNDIVVRDPGVSARHARIVVAPDGMWLEDLGSHNGTFVGSPPRRIERERIELDTPITVGASQLPAHALRDVLERTRPKAATEGAISLQATALLTFGRGADAHVPIDRPLASALHAEVSLLGGRVVVRDLGSENGTYVDGRRVDRPVEIGPGALVQIADRRFRLSADATALEPVDSGADSIEAVKVAVEASGKRLLEGVSLVIQPGELVAVMGPSGAGKSTLLSVLNGQVAPAEGRLVIGGLDLHDHYDSFRGRIGYVPQDDILHADLTVWQALWYAARLRLPKDTSDTEIAARIRKVIAELGLSGTEHTRVGDQRKRGVSGGQRKRVNLAMELLTDPPILVLDEPTSGLSSVDALSVIDLLRQLADSGKTILVTIHQPSLDAYRKFDAVVVIARDSSTEQVGRLAWFGRAWPDAVNFFEPPPAGTTTPASADGLLRGLATQPVREWVRRWEHSVAKSIWVDGRCGTHAEAAGPRPVPRPRPMARLTQWWTLVRRNLAVKAADRWNTVLLFLQAPIVAFLIAGVFSRVVRSEPTLEHWPKIGVNVATTVFVTALAAIWFGCSSTAREIVTEWPIYRRERMVGLSMFSYLASKVTVLLGIAAVQSALLLGIVALTCRLESSLPRLFLVTYAAALAGGALGLLISASFRTAEAAAGVLPVLLLPMIVLGGILVPLADLPRFTQPLAAAMPSRWAFEGLVVPEAVVRPRLRPHATEAAQPAAPPRTPAAPRASAADAAAQRRRVPVVLVADGGGRRFLLPGRQRIADAIEQAADEAQGMLDRAREEAERQADARTAAARREVEETVQRQAESMRREMESKVQAMQSDFETRSARLNDAIESRIKEANRSVEEKLREIQQGIDAERTRMQQTLEQMGGRAPQVVAASRPFEHGDVDMAERFFGRGGWRSRPAVPLAVLGAMAVAGVLGTGIMLRRRDNTGR